MSVGWIRPQVGNDQTTLLYSSGKTLVCPGCWKGISYTPLEAANRRLVEFPRSALRATSKQKDPMLTTPTNFTEFTPWAKPNNIFPFEIGLTLLTPFLYLYNLPTWFSVSADFGPGTAHLLKEAQGFWPLGGLFQGAHQGAVANEILDQKSQGSQGKCWGSYSNI